MNQPNITLRLNRNAANGLGVAYEVGDRLGAAKAQIPKEYRHELLARWSARHITDYGGQGTLSQPGCPLCTEAIRLMETDAPDEGFCPYCPAKWPYSIFAPEPGDGKEDCGQFLFAVLGRALARRAMYPNTAAWRGEALTQAEYSAARQRVLAQIEWTP